MTGTLYGVGLGPGDPELVTLKAMRLISNADVVAYPCLEEGQSFARAIAASFIPKEATEIAIRIPMTTERAPAQAAYDTGAADIARALEAGKNVVVLCEGDPFFYGSFMYLFSRLSDRFQTQVVPGVTSVTACAAGLVRPLTARNEVLTIIPGPIDRDDMSKRIEAASSVAIMKVGRHLPKIREVLEGLGLSDQSYYVERATLPDQRAMALKDAPERAPYFSMVLVLRGDDPWL